MEHKNSRKIQNRIRSEKEQDWGVLWEKQKKINRKREPHYFLMRSRFL